MSASSSFHIIFVLGLTVATSAFALEGDCQVGAQASAMKSVKSAKKTVASRQVNRRKTSRAPASVKVAPQAIRIEQPVMHREVKPMIEKSEMPSQSQSQSMTLSPYREMEIPQ